MHINSITRNNHYVPQMYLKNWGVDGKVYTYRLLVSNKNVPIWCQESIVHTSSLQDIYTQISNGSEHDSVEKWLNSCFESPARMPLEKACRGDRLTIEDWYALINFTACQIVRTPTFFQKSKDNLKVQFPKAIESLAASLSSMPSSNAACSIPSENMLESLPLRLKNTGISIDNDKVLLEISTIPGKSWWFYSMKRLLTKTIKILHNHKWSIMRCSPEVVWPTSDDPVLCINYNSEEDYDFNGGWGNPGSEIFFPISPKIALYVQVGVKHPARICADLSLSKRLERMIVEHAYRKVYAVYPNERIINYRPRLVDNERYKVELEEQQAWFDEYKRVEVPEIVDQKEASESKL